MPPAMEQPLNAPNSKHYNPDPGYLRTLIERAGISQREAARRLGISPRMMRQYLADTDVKTAARAPYLVQYGLECLAFERDKNVIASKITH